MIQHLPAYRAGLYELHGGTAGAILRPGQIVRLEVGFKIVPAGRQTLLRMDLKNVTIVNDEIVAVSYLIRNL